MNKSNFKRYINYFLGICYLLFQCIWQLTKKREQPEKMPLQKHLWLF